MGEDGRVLLRAIYAADAPTWLHTVPAVETLRRMWIQQYVMVDDTLHWRTDQDGVPPSSLFLSSPYDVDAHYGKKHTTLWVGYKVHLTEACDDDQPRLITHVETSGAATADGDVTPTIHQALSDKALLPALHIVDTGYLDAALLVQSKHNFGVDLVGPTRQDYRWQARAGQGFDAAAFAIDWEAKTATCPAGRTSISWSPAIDRRDNAVVKIKFSTSYCRACVSRPHCFHSQAKYPRRMITIRSQAQYVALRDARKRETTRGYREEYDRRAGIEATMSQGIRAFGLRRCRYIGLAKTYLQHVLTAAAINFVRVSEWVDGTPLAKTRRSTFTALMSPTP